MMATMRSLPTMTTPRSSNKYLRTAELINGRSAMMGFTAGAGKMVLDSQPVLQQIHDPAQVLGAVLTVGTVAAGTFITIDERLGMTDIPEPWTPENELLNGRAAMIGILGLTLTL